MASSALQQPPTAHTVGQLLPKLHDPDSDFRYMALNDLYQILQNAQQNFLQHDYNTCARTIDGLLNTLNDSNGEVQNMAVKCLGPFVNKVPESILCPMIDKVSNLDLDNSVDITVPALALREIVVSLPRPIPGMAKSRPIQEAYQAISKALVPRLVGYNVMPVTRKDLPAPPTGMLRGDVEKGRDSSAIDVLTEVARCFGPMLQEAEVSALQHVVFEVLQGERTGSVLKKKAVVAMSALAPYFSNALLSDFVSRMIESLRDPHLTRGRRRLYLTIFGSLARSIPRKFGGYLKTITPFVLSALSQQELDEELEGSMEDEERDPEADEVREAALVALEGFLGSCSQDMRSYTDDCIEAALRFVKYDPNLADDDDDEDMEEDDAAGLDEDEDFEEEGGFDDEDDGSWKVRRCAAKVLYTLISTRSSGDLLEDGTLYGRVAPALIARFKEREENVRLEVLSALSALIRNTSDGAPPTVNIVIEESVVTPSSPVSRKRRRGSSITFLDPQTYTSLTSGFASPAPRTPPTGARASLASLGSDIMRGVAQLLKTGPLPTKQSSTILIKDYVVAQHGGLEDFLSQITDPIVEAIKTTSTSIGGTSVSSAANANSLRIHALQLVGSIAETHSSRVIQPYLAPVMPAVVGAAKDKYSKVSVEALAAIEQLIKALTPPRSVGSSQQAVLEQLFDVVYDRISATDSDLEVRKRAIHALGVLLARSSSYPGLVAPHKRKQGLELLLDRLRNELTRLASVRAIEMIASLARDRNEFSPQWVQTASLELGSQLRKASRALRGASLVALRAITTNSACRANLDTKTVKELVSLLLPLLQPNDLHLLGPALVIISKFVSDNAKIVVTPEINSALCTVVLGSITGSALDSLLSLMQAIGQAGAGAPLMKQLIKDVGIGGNPNLLGKVIGTLLVAGGKTVGFKLVDFIKELNTQEDPRRKCLALAVLGEAGLRMGKTSDQDLQPKLFIDNFSSKADQVPLAAAIALGRAGAGNVGVYLPVILNEMSTPPDRYYLLLHSVKEILQCKDAEPEVIPHTQELWKNLVAASKAEDNKAIGAECIGRLAIIDPKNYLSHLQSFLSNPESSVRGMVISALRYTFADTDETYDEYLKPVVIGMLTTMLNETDLENRRLALTTLNSAAHNKPDLILPYLSKLLPLAMKETYINPALVREVQMGPFKHKVDDGLETRKSAYETLYAFLDSSFSRLNLMDFYDRIIAGIADEHDIRILCNLMLSKLIVLAPEETHARLQSISEHFRIVMQTKPKDNAVKTEWEKYQESQKSILKVSIQLNKIFAPEIPAEQVQDPQIRAWVGYWEWARKEFPSIVKAVEDEIRDRER